MNKFYKHLTSNQQYAISIVGNNASGKSTNILHILSYLLFSNKKVVFFMTDSINLYFLKSMFELISLSDKQKGNLTLVYVSDNNHLIEIMDNDYNNNYDDTIFIIDSISSLARGRMTRGDFEPIFERFGDKKLIMTCNSFRDMNTDNLGNDSFPQPILYHSSLILSSYRTNTKTDDIPDFGLKVIKSREFKDDIVLNSLKTISRKSKLDNYLKYKSQKQPQTINSEI